MEHFITEIKIDKVRHLKDITINLDADKRQHLILTGKNGSGKTSLLNAIKGKLLIINENKENLISYYKTELDNAKLAIQNAKNEKEQYQAEQNILTNSNNLMKYGSGIEVFYCNKDELPALFAHGKFITAFFPANRLTNVTKPQGVENVTLKKAYAVGDDPACDIWRYMVHLRTQQAFAKTERDAQTEQNIELWFKRFEDALKILLNDEGIALRYDYKRYTFLLRQHGNVETTFNELSDGYSSVFRIFADLIMRMDQNWLLSNQLSEYNKEGVVLIDEIETHLHLELQRKILPSLIKLFPRVQFIISTHSPYVVRSVSNALVYDLERQVALTDLSDYSTEDVAEGFFGAESYSDEMKGKLNRYRELLKKKDISDDERAERAELRTELKNVSPKLAVAISDEFESIEQGRK